ALVVSNETGTAAVELVLSPLQSFGPAGPGSTLTLSEFLSQLGEWLIGPVAARLRQSGARSVVLIACGHLGLLALHAACYGPPEARRTLLDDFDVSYSPSARVL